MDVETTGLNRKKGFDVCHGHRVIEVACVEIVDGVRTGAVFHSYVDPGQRVDDGAVRVHGITNEFLDGKPRFDSIADGLVRFIGNGVVVIHNATFDTAFLDKEFHLLPEEAQPEIGFFFIDTLELARKRFPGVRNDLDALCTRAGVYGRGMERHGALRDALLLADVFLELFY